MTMRTKPKLALITVTPKSSFSYVTLSAPGMPDVDIHPPQNTERLYIYYTMLFHVIKS